MERVSVVIPCYHAEACLPDALKSLRGQSYGQWEAVCVDDGSRDGTGAIMDGECRRDARIRGVHQPNCGVSVSRNRGVGLAGGAALFFLDADDRLAPECLRMLGMTLCQTGANWCSCNVKILFSDGTCACSRPKEDGFVDRKDFLRRRGMIDTTVVWGKLFDRVWWERSALRFDERLSVAEDSLLMAQAVCFAERIAHVGSCVGYFYRAPDKGKGLMVSGRDMYPKCRAMALGVLLPFAVRRGDAVAKGVVGEWMDDVFHDAVAQFRRGLDMECVGLLSRGGWCVACSHPKRFAKWCLLLLMQWVGHHWR